MPEAVVAMQMFTLRKQVAEDYPGTLKKVAEIGYKAVQVSGTHSSTAAEIRSVMDDLGLGAAGTHIGFRLFKEDLNAVIDLAKTLGTRYPVVPMAPKEARDSAETWVTFAKEMNEISAKLKEVDLILGYHNHSMEFQTHDGKTGLDILFENLDAGVQAEIDTYWVQHGGGDPVAWLKRFPGRMDLVHFKDMGEGEDKPMVPIGEGILDWPAILDACKDGGAKWLCIEQDRCEPLEPFEAARVSLENCRNWGLA